MALLSCQNKPEENFKMLEISTNNASLDVTYNRQIRLLACTSLVKNTKLSAEIDDSSQVMFFSISAIDSTQSFDYLAFSVDSLLAFDKGLAAYKYGAVKAWTHPVQIRTLSDLNEKDNQFFLWKYNDSTYAALMPLIGNGFVSQIGKEKNKLAIKAYSHIPCQNVKNIPVAAVAFGKNPFETVKTLYEKGLTKTGKQYSLRKNKNFPSMFENLMWCTWNSFGHGLDERKVMQGMDAFKKQGFKLPLLLLDDGWSVVSSYGTGMLQSFETEKTKFPNGFKTLVQKLKSDYGVKEVGVWHAFNGYWAGIDPNSTLGKKYKDKLIPYLDKVAWTENPIDTFWFVSPNYSYEFYDEWHQYLKSEGISFLKVDNQLIMDRISKNNMPFSKTAEKMQSNLQNSANKHFSGNVINCMDMTIDAAYNFGSSAIGRASEDFFPENFTYNMNAGNAAVHILGNVHNSLWWSQMVYPDFDMFQTHHPDAVYHAIVRAISGGPIYITDSPGKTNFDILNRLIYTDGSILRADRPAMPTKDCLFQVLDPKPFKIQSISNKIGLLAILNAADSDSVSGFLSPNDIEEIEGNEFVCYEYFSGQITTTRKNDKIPVSLSRMGYQLYIISPIYDGFAMIGMVNKYNAPKAIISEKRTLNEIEITIKESGIFKAYCYQKPIKILGKNGEPMNFGFENNILQINISEKDLSFKVVL
jgi:hypothetical protein